MARRVRPWSVDGLEAGASITDAFDDLKQVADRPCEATELPYDDNISLAQLVDDPLMLWLFAFSILSNCVRKRSKT